MSALQRHWDARAAANFILGGAGSGLLITSVLLSAPGDNLIITSLVLMAAGLGAVWLEIGRKLRAAHVFINPFTSWMTRESFAALAVFAFGILFLVFHHESLLYATAVAAAAFLWCQGRILYASKGIAVWRAREVVALIVTTGLAEGAALALLFGPSDWLIGALAAAVCARLLAWRRYRAAVRSAALEFAGEVLARAGTAAALLFALVAWNLPVLAPLAALAALAPGWWLKFTLVTRAAFKQDFTLPHLPVRGAR